MFIKLIFFFGLLMEAQPQCGKTTSASTCRMSHLLSRSPWDCGMRQYCFFLSTFSVLIRKGAEGVRRPLREVSLFTAGGSANRDGIHFSARKLREGAKFQ